MIFVYEDISQFNEGLNTHHILEFKSQRSYSAVEASRPVLRFLEKFAQIQSGGNTVSRSDGNAMVIKAYTVTDEDGSTPLELTKEFYLM